MLFRKEIEQKIDENGKEKEETSEICETLIEKLKKITDEKNQLEKTYQEKIR